MRSLFISSAYTNLIHHGQSCTECPKGQEPARTAGALASASIRERKCCLLVRSSVISPPQWIRQPQLRGVHGVCVVV